MENTSSTPSTERILPHPESERIIQNIFPQRLSIDDHSHSDGIGDEGKHHAKPHNDTFLQQSSSSTIGDVEKQDREISQLDQTDRPSDASSRDLEKGGIDSKGNNQNGKDNRQTQWENDVVGWDGPNDPQNPHNWKLSKKYTITVFYATLTFCITFASSIFSTATMVTAKMYGVSNEVMTLGTSLFVLVSAHSQPHPNPSIWR